MTNNPERREKVEAASRILYWAVAGSLMGIGLIAFSLVFLPFLLGTGLALYGARRFGPRGLWVTLLFMGLAPASILVYDYATADGVSVFVPDSYLQIAALFLLIALVGIAEGVLETRRRRRMHRT
jgi:hypothetical protein